MFQSKEHALLLHMLPDDSISQNVHLLWDPRNREKLDEKEQNDLDLNQLHLFQFKIFQTIRYNPPCGKLYF